MSEQIFTYKELFKFKVTEPEDNTFVDNKNNKILLNII